MWSAEVLEEEEEESNNCYSNGGDTKLEKDCSITNITPTASTSTSTLLTTATMSTRNTIDPIAVLRYDPAGVAINAGGDSRMLDKLGEFAGSVKHYSELMKQNAISHSNGTPDGDITELVPTLRAQQQQPTPGDCIDPVTLLHYDPAGLAMRTGGDAKLLNELINFSSSLTYYVGLVQERDSTLGVAVEEETDDETTLDDQPCFLGWIVRKIQ